MKHSSIFFKFSQELYYMMLKQIPVTVCHNFWPIHYSKVSRKWFQWFHHSSVWTAAAIFVFTVLNLLNHQIALHGKIIGRFKLWTEHSEYLKKSTWTWTWLFRPYQPDGPPSDRLFRPLTDFSIGSSIYNQIFPPRAGRSRQRMLHSLSRASRAQTLVPQ